MCRFPDGSLANKGVRPNTYLRYLVQSSLSQVNSNHTLVNSSHTLQDATNSDAVTQLVDALRHKPEGRGLDSRWCHWKCS